MTAWTIQQSGISWNGIGRESMLGALDQRSSRYAERDQLHHREVLVATDACPGGWYTLVADLDARSDRAYRIEVSLQLRGVPVDTADIARLCSRLGVADAGFFRPRVERSVESYRLREHLEVIPRAWMLEHEPDDPHDPLWARAITFTNPISEPDREPLTWLKADSVIVAQLRSWHPASRRPPTYVLERIEWARSSDAVIMRAIADWPRTHDAAVRA